MSYEWKDYLLDEVADLNGGYAFKSDEYTDSGNFVLRTVNITDDGRITKNGATYVSPESAIKYKRFELQNLDTLFVMVGATLGKIGLVRSTDLPALLNQNLWVIRSKNENADPLYLHYAFKVFSLPLTSLVSGSARGFVKRVDFREMKIKLPNLSEQKRIALLLGSIDERINVLSENNNSLDNIAKALFKSWFIDFDPVYSKIEGRAPEYLSEDLAALFPNSLQESKNGNIPEGWTIHRIEDLLELSYGKALKSTNRTEGNIPVYGSGGITGFHIESLIDGPSIIVGRKGTIGSLFWEDRSCFAIDTVFFVKSKKPLTYCYYLLQTLGLSDMNTDAAVPGLNRNNVYRLNIPNPPDSVLDAFDNVVSTLRQTIYNNLEQIKTLSNIRDTLLPRLISGQIMLPETSDDSKDLMVHKND